MENDDKKEKEGYFKFKIDIELPLNIDDALRLMDKAKELKKLNLLNKKGEE